MIDMLGIASASFVVAFSGAAAPGPLLLTTIKESVGRDARVGVMLSLGHALVELPVVVLLSLGLVSIDTYSVVFWLGIVGGIVLVFFGFMTLRSSAGSVSAVDAKEPQTGTSAARLTLLGGVASASNPYWTLWWLTIGITSIVQAMVLGPLGLFVFYLSHIAGDAVVFVSVSALTSRAKNVLGGRGYRILLIVTGIILIAIGAYFVLSALASP
ncbi:MAG TPA: LysE family transporter, partial [Thermoproteota archaeon]|nr:LysE family transporter [Thermoproteota archaeon]